MNFAHCCTKKLEFRIFANYRNIQYKVQKPFEKIVLIFVNISELCSTHLLTFIIIFDI